VNVQQVILILSCLTRTILSFFEAVPIPSSGDAGSYTYCTQTYTYSRRSMYVATFGDITLYILHVFRVATVRKK
jgi:hypothetical protein